MVRNGQINNHNRRNINTFRNDQVQSVTSKVGRFCYRLLQTKHVQHKRKFFGITIRHIIIYVYVKIPGQDKMVKIL